MPHTLSIETSADACNVSLIDAERVVSREADAPRSHARMLVPLIQQLLAEEEVHPEAICVDAGPGSYTGLRIGVSTAKGLAWSLGIPLHAIPSLALMAAGVAAELDHIDAREPLCCLIPGRGNDVYTARYMWTGQQLEVLEEPGVRLLEDVIASSGTDFLVVSASSLAEKMDRSDRVRVMTPHSKHAAPLLRNPGDVYRVEDVSSFEPLYLREFEARKPAVNIFDRLPF